MNKKRSVDDTNSDSTMPDMESLSKLQKKLTIFVLALIILFCLAQICTFFADPLRILGISILISYLFINIVDWLTKYIKNRAAAIIIIYAISAVLIGIGMVLVIPAMIYQITQLIDTTFNQLPQLVQWLIAALTPLEMRLHAAQIQIRAVDILTNVAATLPKPDSVAILSRMSDMAMTTMTGVLYALSIFVVSFYFLLDGRRIKETVIRLFPSKNRAMLAKMTTDVDLILQAFFRGQIVMGGIFGAFMIAVFALLGVHYALLLGVFLAIWEIVPVIGPLIGFIPAVIAVAIHGMDNIHLIRIWQIILIFIVFNAFQWLKDNTIAPKYIGNVIGLHPVLVFIAIMIGARIDGMLGIIFALPAACVANVVIAHLTGTADRLKIHYHAQALQKPVTDAEKI